MKRVNVLNLIYARGLIGGIVREEQQDQSNMTPFNS